MWGLSNGGGRGEGRGERALADSVCAAPFAIDYVKRLV